MNLFTRALYILILFQLGVGAHSAASASVMKQGHPKPHTNEDLQTGAAPSASETNPDPIPLSKIDPNRLGWSLTVSKLVNKYFSKPYKDMQNKNAKFYALKCSDGRFVYRPNHSLAHGLRQAFLAVDIAIAFKNANSSELSPATKELHEWVLGKIKNDIFFLQKIELANAFQRSGRQSEVGRSQDQAKYEAYLKSDQQNFSSEVIKSTLPGTHFTDKDEFNTYKEAIVRKFKKKDPTVDQDLYFLSRIFLASHYLDLRRLPHFRKQEVLDNVTEQLFGTTHTNNAEKKLLDKLWARAGDYLAATGDRDMDEPTKTTWNTQLFCDQAHDPELMVKALHVARSKPQEKLLGSIVAHAQGMSEMKEKFRLGKATPLSVLQQELANMPYTASEGYLKILLAGNYTEIPQEANDEEARAITEKNVRAFLAEVIDNKSVSEVITDSQGKKKNKFKRVKGIRIEKPDKYFVKVLVNALMEERKNRGMYVFYHTTEPEVGFLFDVYSKIRGRLMIQGGSDITTLRAIDRSFIDLDRAFQTEEVLEVEPRVTADVQKFMEKYQGIPDDQTPYRNMVLSTNFSLFGSDQQENADTYNMFYEITKRQVVTQNLDLSKFFVYIESETGIPARYDGYKDILEKHVTTCSSGPCRNGRLIQIFIAPEVLDEMVYFSVLMGAPVLKDGKTPPINIPLNKLRENPTNLLEYLRGSTGTDLKIKPALMRLGQLELHDLQARIFMRPENMFDKRLVKIKSYWRLENPGPAYVSDINQLVQKNLTKWLKEGAPTQPGAMVADTVKLKKFTDIVHKGSTGEDAPTHQISEEDSFVRFLINKQYAQALGTLKRNRDNFKSAEFMIPADQGGDAQGPFSFVTLISFFPEEALVKFAFENSLIKGGKDALDVFMLVKDIKNPSIKLEFIRTIDKLQNAGEILKIASPLIKYFEGEFITKILSAVSSLHEDERGAIITKVLSDITGPEIGENKLYLGLKIEEILAHLSDMKSMDAQKHKITWSILKKLQWGLDGLSFIEDLKSLNLEKLNSINNKLSPKPDEKNHNLLKILLNEEALNQLVNLFKEKISIEDLGEKFGKIGYKRWSAVSTEAHSHITNPTGKNTKGALESLSDILRFISYLQNKIPSLDDRKHLFSMTGQITKNWEERLNRSRQFINYDLAVIQTYIDGHPDKSSFDEDAFDELFEHIPRKKIEWVEDKDTSKQAYGGAIEAPFKPQDIIDHAKSAPNKYEVKLLDSEVGKLLIQTVINQLNKGFVPNNISPSFYSAYNRNRPSEGYNKSLIAELVSKLAQK